MSRVLPILFKTEDVRATLEGRKSCTRRLVKFLPGKNPNWTGYIKDGAMLYNGKNEPCIEKAPYKQGDILYVRETWHKYIKRVGKGESCHLAEFYGYKASIANSEDANEPWKSPACMPKEAARIWLKVTDVRVGRLQEITVDGIRNEGLSSVAVHAGDMEIAIEEWKILWNSTIKKSDLDSYGYG